MRQTANFHKAELLLPNTGYQYSQSLPFPRGHSHSRNLCIVRPIPIPVLFPKTHSHSHSRQRSNHLWPVHTGDYSRRIRRLSPKPAKSPNSATVAVFGDSRRFRWQIVAEIGDYSLQCGQGFTNQKISIGIMSFAFTVTRNITFNCYLQDELNTSIELRIAVTTASDGLTTTALSFKVGVVAATASVQAT